MRRPLILVASMIMCTGWLFAEGTMHRKANGAVTMSAPIRVKDADGNAYRTVAIGSQTWMAENLRTTHYRDGSPISRLDDDKSWGKDKEGAYCSYGRDATKAATYGLLYNGYAILSSRGLCPAGWHVPSDADWQALISHLGGEREAGGKLKEKGSAHWLENVGATDSTGFSALPGGYRFTNYLSGESQFDWLGLRGFYASSTEWGEKAVWCRDLQNLNPAVARVHWTGHSGISVRCPEGLSATIFTAATRGCMKGTVVEVSGRATLAR